MGKGDVWTLQTPPNRTYILPDANVDFTEMYALLADWVEDNKHGTSLDEAVSRAKLYDWCVAHNVTGARK